MPGSKTDRPTRSITAAGPRGRRQPGPHLRDSRLRRFIHEDNNAGGSCNDSPQDAAAPYPLTNEVAALLVLLTTGGTVFLLTLLVMAWLDGKHADLGLIGLGSAPMLGAVALSIINAALRHHVRTNPSPNPTTTQRRYRALDWLEWSTIVLCTGFVLVALNIALPALGAVIPWG